MPAPLIPKDEVLDRLMLVFRQCGYEGATLARLSQATGLVKASLYHYFPGGKEEMAAAVLERASAWLRDNVLIPLTEPGEPVERLQGMVSSLDAFYSGGQKACLLGVLALGDARDLFQRHIREALNAWIDAIATVLVDAGLPKDLAHKRAEDAVLRIQGALVVSRGLDSTIPFRRVLQELPAQLLEPSRELRPAPGTINHSQC